MGIYYDDKIYGVMWQYDDVEFSEKHDDELSAEDLSRIGELYGEIPSCAEPSFYYWVKSMSTMDVGSNVFMSWARSVEKIWNQY